MNDSCSLLTTADFCNSTARTLLMPYFCSFKVVLTIVMRTLPQTFLLISCQKMSTIHEPKFACYRPFKDGHSVRLLRRKGFDYQYRENGRRNTYLTVIRSAYCECYPNQSRKLYPINNFIEQSARL